MRHKYEKPTEIYLYFIIALIKSQENVYQSNILNDANYFTKVKTEKVYVCIMENMLLTPINIDELLNWCHVSA